MGVIFPQKWHKFAGKMVKIPQKQCKLITTNERTVSLHSSTKAIEIPNVHRIYKNLQKYFRHFPRDLNNNRNLQRTLPWDPPLPLSAWATSSMADYPQTLSFTLATTETASRHFTAQWDPLHSAFGVPVSHASPWRGWGVLCPWSCLPPWLPSAPPPQQHASRGPSRLSLKPATGAGATGSTAQKGLMI